MILTSTVIWLFDKKINNAYIILDLESVTCLFLNEFYGNYIFLCWKKTYTYCVQIFVLCKSFLHPYFNHHQFGNTTVIFSMQIHLFSSCCISYSSMHKCMPILHLCNNNNCFAPIMSRNLTGYVLAGKLVDGQFILRVK